MPSPEVHNSPLSFALPPSPHHRLHHHHARAGSHDLFWLLIAYGARCDILDKEGETLTDWARCFKRREMEEPIACALAQARKQAAAAFSV
jgi:hypothetical protein